jgi:hypothetical protein
MITREMAFDVVRVGVSTWTTLFPLAAGIALPRGRIAQLFQMRLNMGSKLCASLPDGVLQFALCPRALARTVPVVESLLSHFFDLLRIAGMEVRGHVPAARIDVLDTGNFEYDA